MKALALSIGISSLLLSNLALAACPSTTTVSRSSYGGSN
jgi:hypothetical protein